MTTRTRRRKTNKRSPSCILTSDWHIRPDQPVARTDDYIKALFGKLLFIFVEAKTYGCPILLAGDLGHRAGVRNWPFWLLHWCLINFPEVEIIAIPGQHDLPNHSLELINESAVGVLYEGKAITLYSNIIECNILRNFYLTVFPFGKSLSTTNSIKRPNIAMTHQMVLEGKPLWPGQKAPKAMELLKKYPQYDLILSGDNHNAFTAEYEGRHLVNPGSLMRSNADQVDHKPRIYLWYAETNEIECVYIPIEADVLSREHIKKNKQREDRYQSFVIQAKESWNKSELSSSFENNMDVLFETTRLRKPVKDKIIGAMP